MKTVLNTLTKAIDDAAINSKPISSIYFTKHSRGFCAEPNTSSLVSQLIRDTSRFCESNEHMILNVIDNIDAMVQFEYNDYRHDLLIGIRKNGIDMNDDIISNLSSLPNAYKHLLYRRIYAVRAFGDNDIDFDSDGYKSITLKMFDITNTTFTN